MKVARGKVHTYLGMTLDFTTKGVVKQSMVDYIDEITKSQSAGSVFRTLFYHT